MIIHLLLQTAATVVSPQNAPESTVLAPFFFTGIGVVVVQKWLKSTVTYGTFVKAFPGADRYAHWAVAAVGSVIGAAGIHITWNWTPATGGAFITQIPPLLALAQGLAHFSSDWLKLYATQHWMYLASNQAPYEPPQGKV